MTNTLVRANRVSVMTEGDAFRATFHRTHKVVATVLSTDTKWVAQEGTNKTAQRETFRAWVCDNADTFGVAYDPADRRDESNQMPAKYVDDTLLLTTAGRLVETDVREWVAKASEEWGIPVEIVSVVGEEIAEIGMHNNKTVSPKYGNGNWAWATVDVVVTVKSGDIEGYATLTCSLVSGQLKKPANIGQLGYTYTGLKTELGKDLAGIIPAKEIPAKETPKEILATDKKPSKKSSKKTKVDAQ